MQISQQDRAEVSDGGGFWGLLDQAANAAATQVAHDVILKIFKLHKAAEGSPPPPPGVTARNKSRQAVNVVTAVATAR